MRTLRPTTQKKSNNNNIRSYSASLIAQNRADWATADVPEKSPVPNRDIVP